MIITGTRFGQIEFSESDIIHFDEGLIGFPKLQEFLLVPHKQDSPFRWLQAVVEPGVAFLVAEPTHFVPDYHPVKENSEETIVLATVTIPAGCPDDMTLNLAGPILVDGTSKKAKQIVLDDGSYTVRHRVFDKSKSVGEKAAA
jgi:flagellar assembly factor FliW